MSLRRNKNKNKIKICNINSLLVFVAGAEAEPIYHSWWPLNGNAAGQSFPPVLLIFTTEALAQFLAFNYQSVGGVVRARRVVVNIFVRPAGAAKHQEKRNCNTLLKFKFD